MGALYRIMEGFHEARVNLTKIESRPRRVTRWQYNFYVDFEGSRDDPKISGMLEKISKRSLFFKVLGTYPMAKQG